MIRQMKSGLFDCSINEMHPGAEASTSSLGHTQFLTSLHSGRNCILYLVCNGR